MSAAHTPGPWVLNPFCAQVDCSKESKLGGLMPVAQMLWPTDERSETETEANARLIAAAPELLNVACNMLALAEIKYGNLDVGINQAFAEARAAIAKARGAQS